ncbi:transporter substrate-binding domain-containing protein [Oleiharenicola sp. Vm1]|uniref:transporter substrate-binding domain-containing protein n=1 Tax=Oleiharenicola sp. Vm1 TaxID=3398393 RepID=UPI0039F5C8A2
MSGGALAPPAGCTAGGRRCAPGRDSRAFARPRTTRASQSAGDAPRRDASVYLPGRRSLVDLPRLAAAPDPLTPEERRFLQQRGALRYAPDPAFPPFEFFRADGRVAGITPEILDLVAAELNVKIEAVHYPTWDAVLEGVRRGEVDLLGTLTRTPEREAFLSFTEAYLSVPNVLYVTAASPWKTGFAELAGRRVGVVRSAGAHAWLLQHHPEVVAVPVANTAEGFRQLSSARSTRCSRRCPSAPS